MGKYALQEKGIDTFRPHSGLRKFHPGQLPERKSSQVRRISSSGVIAQAIGCRDHKLALTSSILSAVPCMESSEAMPASCSSVPDESLTTNTKKMRNPNNLLTRQGSLYTPHLQPIGFQQYSEDSYNKNQIVPCSAADAHCRGHHERHRTSCKLCQTTCRSTNMQQRRLLVPIAPV